MATRATFISHRIDHDGVYVSGMIGAWPGQMVETFVARDEAELFGWIDSCDCPLCPDSATPPALIVLPDLGALLGWIVEAQEFHPLTEGAKQTVDALIQIQQQQLFGAS